MDIAIRYFWIFILTSSVLLAFSYWAVEQFPTTQPAHNLSKKDTEAIAVNLPSKNRYERCVELRSGDTLAYGFLASAPVRFNLHYHDREDHFPVPEQELEQFEREYTAEQTQVYCLQWGNAGDRPVRLEYQFEVQPK
ncbi:MAG: hypothetical protein VX610_06575 [SAR324 cluster bacterium]|nr:hypothetical protein [SAR324 cluster bacterium]